MLMVTGGSLLCWMRQFRVAIKVTLGNSGDYSGEPISCCCPTVKLRGHAALNTDTHITTTTTRQKKTKKQTTMSSSIIMYLYKHHQH